MICSFSFSYNIVTHDIRSHLTFDHGKTLAIEYNVKLRINEHLQTLISLNGIMCLLSISVYH